MRLAIFLVICGPAFSADIYFAQSSAGSNNGADCADAYSAARFNTADSNWTAGNTLHLCGTWAGSAGSTALLATRASGSSGNPITIKFEPGAGLTAPYWATTSAFQINHNYIVVDGGVNGTIQATANGTTLMYQADSEGIHIGEGGTPHDVEIKNLTIFNMCQRAQGDADTGCTGNAIKMVSGNGNILIHNNVLHDSLTGVDLVANVTGTGDAVYSNTIYNTDISVQIVTNMSSNWLGFSMYSNSIGDHANWDDPANNHHHNALHTFVSGGQTGSLNGALVYSNYMYGNRGASIHITSDFFFESYWNAPAVFNNLHVNFVSGTAPANGYVYLKAVPTTTGGAVIVNNTYNISVAGGIVFGVTGTNTSTFENNLISSSGNGSSVFLTETADSTGTAIDYNVYYGVGFWKNPTQYTSLASWQSATGFDSHSTTANPNLTASNALIVGSSAVGAGVNLTSLCGTTPGICIDAGGVARPSSGAWDIGAYAFVNGTAPSGPLSFSGPISFGGPQ